MKPSKVISNNLYDYIDLFKGPITIERSVSAQFHLPPRRFFEHSHEWEYGGVVFLVDIEPSDELLIEGYVNDTCIGGQHLYKNPGKNFIYYDLPTPPLRRGDNTLVISSTKEVKIGRVDIWIAVRRWF